MDDRFYEKPDLASLEEFLLHYGTPHVGNTSHSGRYPWGSGENPNQHDSGDFVSRVKAMRKNKVSFYDDREFKVDKKQGKSLQILIMVRLSMETLQ